MSVLRQGNWLGQQRVDVPHIRALESSIAADFDVLAGLILGGGAPSIVKGFNLVTTSAVGNPATSLQLSVAGGLVIHYGASESGSIFWVPSTRANETLNLANTNITGSFTASSTNYIGIDLIRSADSTTSDNVQFLDANSLIEISRTVPLGRTLNYKIVISVVPFSANTNICPIAKVATDANNNVTSVVDARRLLYRLGSGGDVPSSTFAYSWPQGRSEATATDVFSGGDKTLGSFSDWSDAIMTRLWEVGGGEYWYSQAADRNVRMIGEGTVMASGDYFTWSGTDLTWQNLLIIFNNSTGFYNEITNQTTTSSGLTNLATGECLYVDIDRTQNRTRAGANALVAVKTTLTGLGSPTIPGSRYVIAWRTAAGNVIVKDHDYTVGQTIAATTTNMGSVKLAATPPVAAFPVVAPVNAGNIVMAAGIIRDTNSLQGVGALGYTASVAATLATAHVFDNSTAQTTGTLLDIRTGGVSKISIGAAGAAITWASQAYMQGSVASTGNVATVLDNVTTQTTGTITSFRTGGAEKAFIDFSGSFQTANNINLNTSGGVIQQLATNISLSIKGNRNAADTGADVVLNSTATRTAGVLVSIQNNTVEKAKFDFSGNLSVGGTVVALPATGLTLKGNVTGSAAVILDSVGAMTGGVTLISFRNANTEKASISESGVGNFLGGLQINGSSLFIPSYGFLYTTLTGGATIVNGATAVLSQTVFTFTLSSGAPNAGVTYSATNGTIQVAAAGVYEITISVSTMPVTAAGDINLIIQKNGAGPGTAPSFACSVSPTVHILNTYSDILTLAANDTVNGAILNSTGTSQAFNTTTYQLSIKRIG